MKKLFTIAVLGMSLFVSNMLEAQNKIISLAPSLTKCLYQMNAQDNLIGCTSYCFDAKADNIPVVASAIKVNTEKIISMQPNLVITTVITNPETIELLKKFDIKVKVFPTPKNFDEICSQFLSLAALVSKSVLAKQLICDVTKQVDSLKALVKKGNKSNVLFQIGVNPIFTVLPNTFMDDYIKLAGGYNIANDLKHGTISREFVLSKNPSYIIIADMGVLGNEEKQTWLSYPNLVAGTKQQIYVIDSDMACTPTPLTFVQTLDTLIHILNK